MKRGTKVGLLFGFAGTVLGLVLPAVSLLWLLRPAAPKEPLALQLDTAGPYVILSTKRSETSYASAIKKAVVLHTEAKRITFEPDNLDDVHDALKRIQPR